MVNSFIEHYGTGGGLCRPLMADFLTEAAEALKDSSLRDLAERYAELGKAWTELADAALPDRIPLFRETKQLHARKAELINSGSSPDEIRAVWDRLHEIEQQVKSKFPLSLAECAELRSSLQERARALHKSEVDAHEAMGRLIR